MTLALLVGAALSVVVGIVLGMMGGGGAILTVPILVYVLSLEPKTAMATSAVVVGATALLGLALHARAGRVRYRTGVLFGAGGLVGAYAGGRLAGAIPGSILLTGFAVLMVATSGAMIRRRARTDSDTRAARADAPAEPAVPSDPTAHATLVALGVVTGLVTGLVGAGGGFLIVPALVLAARLPMREAVATSLLVIVGNSAATFAAYLGHTALDWTVTVVVTACALAGAVAGTRLSAKIPQAALRTGFGYFVLATGTLMLGQRFASSVAAAGGPSAWLRGTGLLATGPSLLVTIAVSAAVGTVVGGVGYSLGRRSARTVGFSGHGGTR